jgi:hypothetical protein
MLYILYEIGKGPFALEFGFRSWNGTLIDFIKLGNDSNATSLHRGFSVAAVLKARGAKAP